MIKSIPVIQRTTLGGARAEVMDLPPEYRQSPGSYTGFIHTAAGPVAKSWSSNGRVWSHWTERSDPEDPYNLLPIPEESPE